MRTLIVIFLIAAAIMPAAAKSESSASGQTASPGGLSRTAEVLALHKFNRNRQLLTTDRRSQTMDQGNVSVIQDDGTLIIPLNPFDLSNRSVTFTPQGSGYAVQTGSLALDSGQGTAVVQPLRDDDSVPVSLPFTFAFYGLSYTTVFVNTDGNLTFGAADAESTDRNLRRVMQGPPRIAPLFDDFTPSATGVVSVERLSDRVIVNWSMIREFGANRRSSFQMILRANGVVQFNYQSVNVSLGVAALSPGDTSTVQLTDFSQQTASTVPSGVIAEIFSNSEQLDLAAISQRFYATHKDSYDELILFSDFNIDLMDAFAYEIPIRNDIQGIMPDFGTFDFGSDFGSASRLAAMVNAGAIDQYPADPQQIFLGTNNTLEVLGQEFGHRWLADIDTTPSSMLGRDLVHWSFFMDTLGSVMEGNEIQDLGNGRFRTVAATYQYSPLDQYIMGLRSPSEVPPWFIVANPAFISGPPGFSCLPLNAACPPAIGVEMQGRRRDMTIQDVVSIAGPRVPGSATAQKNFEVAFVLITKRGQEANPKSVAHVDSIRQQWEQFFVNAVGGRGSMTTRLEPLPISQFQFALPANGSTTLETASAPTLQVGYGEIDSAAGVAVIRSFSGSSLVSEAAVPASPSGTHWIMYAEKGSNVSTGIAIANPGSTAANLTLRLSDGRQAALQIPAGGQHAAFVDQLFSNLSSFLGTLAVDSDTAISVLALRGTQTATNNFIVATIPLTSNAPGTGGITVCPIVVDGGPYNTELILVNSGSITSSGTVVFSFDTRTDIGTGTRFPFTIPPGGAWHLRTVSTSPTVRSGYVTLNVDSSSPMPDSTAMVRFSNNGDLVSETAIPAQHSLSRALVFGSFETNLRTGIAILNPYSQNIQVTLTPRNANGNVAAAPKTISLTPFQQVSAFLDELNSNVPIGFEGTVLVEASSPVYAVSLRGTNLPNGGFLMAGMPVIDIDHPVPGTSYFPQVAAGGTFSTEFLLANTGANIAELRFVGIDGQPLSISLK